MSESDLHFVLDGNAAAALHEIFIADVTRRLFNATHVAQSDR